MAGVWFVSHFIKHLNCTLPRRSHRLIHHLPPPSGKFNRQRRPFSSLASVYSAAASDNPSTRSFSPPCTSVLLHCRKDVADMLSEALLCFGATSVSMDEHDDYEDSDEVSICSIFAEECEDVHSSISRAADSIGMEEAPNFEILKYNPYDWIKRTQESFVPVKVNENIWVVPEWKAPPDPEATNILINPGRAFGTGEHATTKMCLQLLHDSIKGDECFLDYGTGSGILSIAALKLGASVSVGVDIDPQAMIAAHHNAVLNNIGPDKLKLCLVPETDKSVCSDDWMNRDPQVDKFIAEGVLTDNKYDIVIANILVNPLLDLAEEIVSHAKQGALIGLSGILTEQVPKVIQCYSHFLDGISVLEMEDWACISGRKKRDSVNN